MTTSSLERISLKRVAIEASLLEMMADRELLERIVRVAGATRYLTAELLALIGECDARRLYLGEGCSSLFTYCTQVLPLSEHAAYHRIEAARAARRFPIILEMLAEGAVTLTTTTLLRPHLTEENHRQLLAAARHRSKREVEHQVACLAPKAEVTTVVRRLPSYAPVEGALLAVAAGVADATATTVATVPPPTEVATTAQPTAVAAIGGTPPAPEPPGPFPRDAALLAAAPLAATPLVVPPPQADPPSRVAPLSADRYLLRITLSAAAHARLRRAQALMGHRVPDGDPAAVIDEALSLLVDHLERTKFAQLRRRRRQSDGSSASSPPPSASTDGSRNIPAAMRRQVWSRDEGRCAFVGTGGRCTETGRLEFHHVIPFARGGPTTAENLALRCRAHNGYESELAFGPRVRRGTGLTSEPEPSDKTGH